MVTAEGDALEKASAACKKMRSTLQKKEDAVAELLEDIQAELADAL